MRDIQFLTIEIGNKCNLAYEHFLCPILLRKRKNKTISDEMILSTVRKAYEELGFTGYVAWHFYNEPMLYKKRMFSLMKTLKETVKGVKFVLWTNGELLKKDKELELFDLVFITNYKNRPISYFEQFFKNQNVSIMAPVFDNRLNIKGKIDYRTPCLRPFIEFIISFYGEVHMCCQDWKNDIKIGNIFNESLESLLDKRDKLLSTISKGMSVNSPKTCITCNGRLPFMVKF